MSRAGKAGKGENQFSSAGWAVETTAAVRSSLPGAVKKAVNRLLGQSAQISAPWEQGDGFRRRKYRSNEEYVAHQQSKLEHRAEFVSAVDQHLERVLTDRIPGDVAGKGVLCLAARLGGEVRAFRSAGAFAVGIDLNPGSTNRWVLPGDFHELDFADESVDIVYTNSLDHALDLDRVAAEVMRVVKPDGMVVLEVAFGSAEGGDFGNWEATAWDRIDDVVDAFERRGMIANPRRVDLLEPWRGQQVCLEKGAPAWVNGSGPCS